MSYSISIESFAHKWGNFYDVEIGDFNHRVSRLGHADFFSWIAHVTGGVAIGVEQIDDIVDIIKAILLANSIP